MLIAFPHAQESCCSHTSFLIVNWHTVRPAPILGLCLGSSIL